VSGLGERPRDRGFDACIRRLHGGGKHLRDVAVAAHQVFVEVPAWNILRPRAGRPLVEGMRIRTVDHGLGRDQKGFQWLGGPGGLIPGAGS
jgi:hypothetical protein